MEELGKNGGEGGVIILDSEGNGKRNCLALYRSL